MYPILLNLKSIPITSYMVCLLAAAAVTTWLGGLEARRTGLVPGHFYHMCLWMCVAFFLGSYLNAEVFAYLYRPQEPWHISGIFHRGLVFHGGLLLALTTAMGYLTWRRLPWRSYLDCLAVGLPLGQALGRLGCFLGGCCRGSQTDVPWGVTFPTPYINQLRPVPVHPVQLYEALLLVGVFGVIFWWRRRRRFPGELLAMYVSLAGWVRFGVEFFRSPADYRGPVFLTLPFTQWLALLLAIGGGALWWWGRRPPP